MIKTINYENILNCLQQIDFKGKLSNEEETLLFKMIIKDGIEQFKKDTGKKEECAYCKKKDKIHVDINSCLYEASGKIKFEWLCDECEKELNKR